MSQFPVRAAYSSKLPERTATSYQTPAGPSQASFGQSAPSYAFAKQPPGPSVQSAYGAYPQYAAGPPPARQSLEKDSNTVNDLSEEQRDEINEAFSIFDLDRDRHLDFHELRVALRALGFTPPKPEIVQIISRHGVPKPNAITVNSHGTTSFHPSQLLVSQQSFSRVAAEMMLARDPKEEIERAFYLFDVDHKDYISLDDLRRVTRELGETSLEEQELQNMIEEFDYEGRGGVSKDAFFGICLQ